MDPVITPLTHEDAQWADLATYAAACSWSAGPHLAGMMRANTFTDWERVFVASIGDQIAGFCSFAKTDCIPDVPYTPYIGFLFVDEHYRGHRISEKMIRVVLSHAKDLGFDRVYLVSDHVNLYEKYGFAAIDMKPAPWDPETQETIYAHDTCCTPQEECCR